MTWFQRKREAIVLKTEKFEIVGCFKCLRHHLVFEHKWWVVKLTSLPTRRQHVMDTGSTFFLRGSRTWHSIIHYLPANIANNTLTRPSAEAKAFYRPSLPSQQHQHNLLVNAPAAASSALLSCSYMHDGYYRKKQPPLAPHCKRACATEEIYRVAKIRSEHERWNSAVWA